MTYTFIDASKMPILNTLPPGTQPSATPITRPPPATVAPPTARFSDPSFRVPANQYGNSPVKGGDPGMSSAKGDPNLGQPMQPPIGYQRYGQPMNLGQPNLGQSQQYYQGKGAY